MSFITTFNSVTYFLIVLSVLTMIAHLVIYKTDGYSFSKLTRTIYVTNGIAVVFTLITIVTCFIDLRAVCTFMLWSTIATAPIGIVLYYGVKKQIKKIMADAAAGSKYPQAYGVHQVDADFAASK